MLSGDISFPLKTVTDPCNLLQPTVHLQPPGGLLPEAGAPGRRDSPSRCSCSNLSAAAGHWAPVEAGDAFEPKSGDPQCFLFLPSHKVPDGGIDSKGKTFCMQRWGCLQGAQPAPSHCRELSRCPDPPAAGLQQPLRPALCPFSAGREQRDRRRSLVQSWQGVKYCSNITRGQIWLKKTKITLNTQVQGLFSAPSLSNSYFYETLQKIYP